MLAASDKGFGLASRTPTLFAKLVSTHLSLAAKYTVGRIGDTSKAVKAHFYTKLITAYPQKKICGSGALDFGPTVSVVFNLLIKQ
ncbi:hypothetical protein NOR51B_578 [Luminiphilus syltensis NOR5-1B]|uniref:Uncharacterized protein n=1 Tax=Luminiphilus syltensis NOR5-1B TaxID=565045 RepID=B8KUE6_9GAMM|nr:hypothetical protein [Luminiphilus syltensis]EED34640.1 hypothetical protein NOR51B_578 [Luminiphilus syltensis NOR5-1B]